MAFIRGAVEARSGAFFGSERQNPIVVIQGRLVQAMCEDRNHGNNGNFQTDLFSMIAASGCSIARI